MYWLNGGHLKPLPTIRCATLQSTWQTWGAGVGRSQLLWLLENRRQCSNLLLEVVLVENRPLSNPWSQPRPNLEVTFHIYFFLLPACFLVYANSSQRKGYRLSEWKPNLTSAWKMPLKKKKLLLICHLTSVLFEHYPLLYVFFSYMDKIISFKRDFTFHSDY